LSVSNQLNNFNGALEDGAYNGGKQMNKNPLVDLSIRDWYEGTKAILKDRTSYKHRLEMMVLVGAEPLFNDDFEVAT